MKNKKLLLALEIGVVSLGVLGTCALSGYVGYCIGTKQVSKANETDKGINAEVNENGINVKMVYNAATTEDTYGSYTITYTVTPEVYTDEIKTKLTFADGSEVDSSILSIDHDTMNRKVTVHCKKVFTSNVTLTLYAESNSNVKATMTFDFREKLTVDLPDSITLNEGEIPSIAPTITSTGGTLSVDKTVKDVTYKWNSEFLTWVTNQTKKKYSTYKSEMSNVMMFEGDMTLGDYVGLNDSDCSSFFSTKFNAQSFLASKGCKYSWVEAYSDDDSDDPWSTCNGTFYLGSAGKTDFLTEFNGTNPIIDYACKVNGVTYSKSFGLNISAINVTGISLSNTSYVF